jgi:O-succinylbenzoate synthase
VTVGIQPNERQLVEIVGRFVQSGYPRVRLKIRPGRDLADVRAVRRSFPTLMLQVDANSAYRLEDLSVFKALDELDLQMIEQPLGEADLLDHSRLQSQLRTPICLDESIRDSDHARWALELGSCRVINIRPGRVGGLNEARRIHDLCKARQIPVWCGGMLETGVGRAANLALATLPDFKLPGDIAVSNGYYAEDLVEEPFTLGADGTLPVPAGAGIGVTVRRDLLQRVTLRKARFTAEIGGIPSGGA